MSFLRAFHVRKTIRVGPFYAVFTENGFSSWGVKWGRFTRNVTRGTTTIDTPGPGYLRFGGRRRR